MNLQFFNKTNILESTLQFFSAELNIKIAPAAKSEINLAAFLKEQLTDWQLLKKVKDARFVGMINTLSFEKETGIKNSELPHEEPSGDYDMLLVFGIELNENTRPVKKDISRLTRALNRRSFSRPVVLILKYGTHISFSSAERGQYKQAGQTGEKIGRISILRDIDTQQVHAGHERILLQLRINPLKVRTFKELYVKWLEVFNVNILNKEFYNELFTWYLWAIRTVSFPIRVDDPTDLHNRQAGERVYNSENVIRLLTRLIFIWFVKEKRLVPEALFDKTIIAETLNNFNPNAQDNSDYYKAILQNMFFATFNTDMPKDGGKRAFIDEAKKNKNTGYTEEYLDHLVFRYKKLFANPDEGLKLFENIPFLNGGLFECLDRRDPETKVEMRIDGFSSTASKQPEVPNVLFFGRNDDLDLSDEFENGNKYKHCKTRGIINILNSYKFTIEENTPLEQEIALDPELLGKIFENLLASYNPETRTTARKQTGSYYTPREIVNYMVDESLIAYLKTKLSQLSDTLKVSDSSTYQQLDNKQTNMLDNEGKVGQLDMHMDLANGNSTTQLSDTLKVSDSLIRKLFAYECEENPFAGDEETTRKIINALSECKILDPACGSGAYPMGILHKMVFALSKLDPCNYTWKQAQLEKAQRDKQRAQQFEDETLRETALKSAEDKIAYVEASFGETGHELDYARKLFLIENCIYGVDIQQIAVQISKLRFFISLMVDQRADDGKPNRNILSLPNLETKFVAANTLIPVDKPQQLMFKDPEVERTEKELHAIHQKIFFTRNYSDKKRLKYRELQTRLNLRKLYVDKAGYSKEAAEKITQWNPFDPLKAAPFFDPEVMFTIEKDKQGGYFDVVIGNPPYGIVFDLKLKEIYESNFPTFKRNNDIYVAFIECSLLLNKYGGLLTFITPNTFLNGDYFKNLRKHISEKSFVTEIVDFKVSKVFQDPTVFVSITILQRVKKVSFPYVSLLKISDETFSKLEINKLQFFELNDKPFKVRNQVVSKIETLKVGKFNLDDKYFVKDVGFNYWTVGKGKKRDGNSIGDRILYSGEILHKKDKSFLKGKDIDRYCLQNPSNYLRHDYLSYLDENDVFRYSEDFLEISPKIVYRQTANKIIATLDYDKRLCDKTIHIIVPKTTSFSLKYILALLNSSLFNYLYADISQETEGRVFAQVKTVYIKQLPIIEIKENLENLFVAKVDLLLKKISNIIIKQIDLMVYKLYTLTYDECKIVDPEIEKLISREDYEGKSIEQLSGL